MDNLLRFKSKAKADRYQKLMEDKILAYHFITSKIIYGSIGFNVLAFVVVEQEFRLKLGFLMLS